MARLWISRVSCAHGASSPFTRQACVTSRTRIIAVCSRSTNFLNGMWDCRKSEQNFRTKLYLVLGPARSRFDTLCTKSASCQYLLVQYQLPVRGNTRRRSKKNNKNETTNDLHPERIQNPARSTNNQNRK